MNSGRARKTLERKTVGQTVGGAPKHLRGRPESTTGHDLAAGPLARQADGTRRPGPRPRRRPPCRSRSRRGAPSAARSSTKTTKNPRHTRGGRSMASLALRRRESQEQQTRPTHPHSGPSEGASPSVHKTWRPHILPLPRKTNTRERPCRACFMVLCFGFALV